MVLNNELSSIEDNNIDIFEGIVNNNNIKVSDLFVEFMYDTFHNIAISNDVYNQYVMDMYSKEMNNKVDNGYTFDKIFERFNQDSDFADYLSSMFMNQMELYRSIYDFENNISNTTDDEVLEALFG